MGGGRGREFRVGVAEQESVYPSHLYPGMAAEVEVKLCWMSHAHVHRGTCRDVATLANLVVWEGRERESYITT